MCLKQKGWSKRGCPTTSTRCPDHFIRQFLTTASTFPYCIKNSSAEDIRAFYTCLCVRECVCVCMCVYVCEWTSQCVTLCVFVYVSEWVLIRVRHVGKVWICSAEEFLELYGKVEMVIRNCLLRWSEHLVEVAGNPFSISHFVLNILTFCAPIRAYFCWFINA